MAGWKPGGSATCRQGVQMGLLRCSFPHSLGFERVFQSGDGEEIWPCFSVEDVDECLWAEVGFLGYISDGFALDFLFQSAREAGG